MGVSYPQRCSNPEQYSNGIPAHQEMNCSGCHMGEASPNDFEGGHTWRPRIEVCQECHGQIKSFQDIKAAADYNGNGIVESAFAELGTINPDSGLFGQLKAALQAKGIYYNPDQNPYFFTGSDFKTNLHCLDNEHPDRCLQLILHVQVRELRLCP